MDIDEIISQTRKLHDSAAEIRSLQSAQAAVRQVCKALFYLARHVKAMEDNTSDSDAAKGLAVDEK